jgi:hypothetical protein
MRRPERSTSSVTPLRARLRADVLLLESVRGVRGAKLGPADLPGTTRAAPGAVSSEADTAPSIPDTRRPMCGRPTTPTRLRLVAVAARAVGDDEGRAGGPSGGRSSTRNATRLRRARPRVEGLQAAQRVNVLTSLHVPQVVQAPQASGVERTPSRRVSTPSTSSFTLNGTVGSPLVQCL